MCLEYNYIKSKIKLSNVKNTTNYKSVPATFSEYTYIPNVTFFFA